MKGQAGYSGSNSLLFGVKRGGSAWMSGAAGVSAGSGPELSSLTRIRSILRALVGGSTATKHLSRT